MNLFTVIYILETDKIKFEKSHQTPSRFPQYLSWNNKEPNIMKVFIATTNELIINPIIKNLKDKVAIYPVSGLISFSNYNDANTVIKNCYNMLGSDFRADQYEYHNDSSKTYFYVYR